MGRRTTDRYQERRDRAARAIREAGCDAFLVSHPVNVSYLTGFSGDSSSLLLTGDKAILLSDPRFTEQIAEECPEVEAFIRRPGETILNILTRSVKAVRARHLAFESHVVTVAEGDAYREALPSVQWKGVTTIVESLRAVKDADEIAQIREAIAMAEKAFALFRASLRPSDTEKQLADQMEMLLRQRGATSSAFAPIIAVGPRAALPHATPTSSRVEASDFLLVDWGAKGRFYHSDLTRILVTRKISPKLSKIYDVVWRAQRAAIEAVRPGATGEEVDRAARAVIEAAGFGGKFGHGTGHGLGMQVHEAPALRKGGPAVLAPGMVVTIEPGIYLKGWGGVRLEDDVLVTPDGREVLTRVEKALEAMIVA